MERPRHKYCLLCGKAFTSVGPQHLYCDDCGPIQRNRKTRPNLMKVGRYCRHCGKHFMPQTRTSQNVRACSEECAIQGARDCRSRFYERNPGKMREYHATAKRKAPNDNNIFRFFRQNPTAPRACESCGETRVLDVAHRPEHRRNGAWRKASRNKWPDHVWVLCPTCHALLDRCGYDPGIMGLA